MKRPGAEPGPGGVAYAVWAPDQPAMSVVVEADGGPRELALERDPDGFWSCLDGYGRAGDRYRFRLGPGGALRPDPASRFQPEGVHGPSECIDPGAYAWQADGWRRPGWRGQPVYELHVGTFTPEGTFAGAAWKLAYLRELGVEAVELMPLADFAGGRNWGYDGVALYAPARCYGRPHELRALVDEAHRLGLAVILDVVYNHLGPAGNYLAEYCADYFRADRPTPWGTPFNLDGPRSGPVRALVAGNAAYWLDEFRFDGLRLDATHAIADDSPRHILAEIAAAAQERGAFVIAEDERNEAALLRPRAGGGCGLDALWADDFHHEVRVALTGTRHSYYAAYQGRAGDIAETIAHGWSYRGRPFAPWQGRPRGGPCDPFPPRAFVCCIENHDQVGNRARGERLEHLVAPAAFRAASLLLCLCPYTPLLFMGQEWAAETPFLYFTDHGGDLGRQISAGRQREFRHSEEAGAGRPADPETLAAFEASKLQWAERSQPAHTGVLALYREALRERRLLQGQGPDGPPSRPLARGSWLALAQGNVIALRYLAEECPRLLLVALCPGCWSSADLSGPLAPSAGGGWRVVIDSNAERFGGSAPPPAKGEWILTGPGALWLAAGKGRA